MEGLDALILDLAYILVVAGITTLVFKKINQPVVLGYIVAGFLTGPNFGLLPTILGKSDISVWGDMGIIFLMFALGLEFSFHKIANVGGSAIITAMTVIGAMIFLGYAIGDAMGWSRMDCIFLGGMISMSSTSIILKAYEEMDLKKESFASLVLGALVLEDIAGIFMMIILSTISVSKNVDGVALAENIAVLLLYLVLWLVLGIFLIPSFLKKADKLMNDETLLIVSLGLCLGMVVLANFIGFSSALGAFVAGSILAGTVKAEEIEHLVKPIKDLFGAVFFVSVGMLVDPTLLVEYWLPILIITLAVVVGQNLFSTIGVLLSGQNLHTAVRAGFSMVQIGEFSFIIATLGTSLGVTSDFLYPVIVCVSVITTFLTPMFIKSGEKAYGVWQKILPDRLIAFFDRYTSGEQSAHDNDSDWKNYLGRYLIKTLICSAILFAIYSFSRFVLPNLLHSIGIDFESGLIIPLLTVAAMAPFISIMCSVRRNMLYKKLWVKHPANRLPLIGLNLFRLFLSAMMIGLVLQGVFRIPSFLMYLAALGIAAFLGRSEFIRGASLRLEARFFTNYNERSLQKLKESRAALGKTWASEELYVSEVVVTDDGQGASEGAVSAGVRIRDLTLKREYGIDIIKVRCGSEHYVLPSADFRIKTGDVIHVMGTLPQLDAYEEMLKRSSHADSIGEKIKLSSYINEQEEEGVLPEDQVMLCAVHIRKNGRFDKKQIKNAGFREKFGGTIIAVERGDMTILSPEASLQIETDDIIWAMGNRQMAENLYASGYLDE